MKKLCLALLLFSTQSVANNFYGGANLAVFNETELDVSGLSVDEKSDLGIGGFVGYSVSLSPHLKLGFEVEYQRLGKTEFGSVLTVESDAYYFNLRPKWVEEGNNLYSALILGIGSMESELSLFGMSAKDSEISYQAGVEVGYMFDDLDIGIGYRYQFADFGGDFSGLDISNQGVTLTARYNF